MKPPATTRHEVAVIRVEIRATNNTHLLIELLEVGRTPNRDRLLGRTTDPTEACRLLENWLATLTDNTA
ncbi:hypothetical protein Acsp04_65270 [Actinomadura sp. NBRC 104425]|uniref:hypothetical protein n=1 Tax=Actinomadura sp. NBRC 104425 TaxID=3032204 RepID=UPI0024A09A51|nr:hypothetical protein [Actinomadura sp. NBRC 104425]GLZ16292.1 hypothetical protein Acsp04_65270 [Actinomadura sp. NBRC 104425]